MKRQYKWNKPVHRVVHNIFIKVFLLSILILVFLETYSCADEREKPVHRPIHLILIEGLSFERLAGWIHAEPAFKEWIEKSYIGAMSMRTAAAKSVENEIITMATGVKREIPVDISYAVQLEENKWILPGLPHWIDGVRAGSIDLLGEILEAQGYERSIILPSMPMGGRMWAAPLVVNEKGEFPHPLFLEDSQNHSGGDLLVYQFNMILDPWEIDADREIINFILALEKRVGLEEEIWILSPSGDLTPIIFHSPKSQGGILSSPTTRQDGIVSNVDVMPTVLNRFQIPLPTDIEGRPMDVLQGSNLQEGFFKELEKIFYIYNTRPKFLYQVVSVQVLLLIGTLLFIYLFSPRKRWVSIVGHYALIYVLMIPLFLLLLGYIAPILKIWQLHLYLLAGGIGAGILFRRLRPEQIYLWISFIYITVLLMDGIMGNEMMKRSFLGYDPIIGARFYGIGNEYMGALVGSGILFCMLMIRRSGQGRGWSRKGRITASFLVMFVILLYLGLPNAGSNAGGTITWLVAMLLMSCLMLPGILRGKGILLLLGGIGVLFLLFLGVQYIVPENSQTHVGRLLHQIVGHGPGVLEETIERKWAMNMRLIRGSNYSKLFVTSVLVLGWFLLRTRRKWRRNPTSSPDWRMVISTIFWVSLVNLLVNDSGVVAAAMGLLFAAVPLIHIIMTERHAKLPTPG